MRVTLLFVALSLAATAASASPQTDNVIENVRLPTGFKKEVYTDHVRLVSAARSSSALAPAAAKCTQ